MRVTTGIRPKHNSSLNQGVHTWKISQHLSTLPLSPSPHTDIVELTERPGTLTVARRAVLAPAVGRAEAERPTGRLLRRPRVPADSGPEPGPTVNIDAERLETWRVWSYTTFPDHAPFTPESYYVRNYPLALEQVPKRTPVRPHLYYLTKCIIHRKKRRKNERKKERTKERKKERTKGIPL